MEKCDTSVLDKLNRKPIYTITTLRGSLHGGRRCVGFYHELESAITSVEENDMDINEAGYYHYAVIEKVNIGMYNFAMEELWFKWHPEKGYQVVAKPKNFKSTIAFGMG